MVKLSIILPVYNGSRFLEPQLESILAQSDGDFELLAIDDGSSDDSRAILDRYALRDPRVRHLPASGNRGQNRRLIELLTAAKGEYVAIADQDDVWDQARNARLLEAIGDRAIACGRSQLIDANGTDLGASILAAKGVDGAQIGPLSALFCPLVSAHAAVIRRSWLDHGAFYGALPFDIALGLEALFSAGLIYNDEAIVHHRIHGANQMNGDVTVGKRPQRWLSRHRLRSAWAQIPAGRVALYQTLDQLSRSGVLAAPERSVFRHLASTSWNVWFGIGGRGRSLEREFHIYLDSYAGSNDDLARFSARLKVLTSGRLSPAGLAQFGRDYTA